MIKKFHYQFIIIYLINILYVVSLSAEVIKETPNDILPAAIKILSRQFQSPLFQKIGFPPYFQLWDNLEDFKLGEPFPYYVLNAKAFHDLRNTIEDALEFTVWKIPIYLADEKEPRTFLDVEKIDGEWRFAGIGGLPNDMFEARSKWPIDKGYHHAAVFNYNLPGRLIMIERADTLHFYIYSSDSSTAKLFNISRNSDGYYPLLSLDSVIQHIKWDWRYKIPEKSFE